MAWLTGTPRIPPPTVCTHPRNRWIAFGSGGWSSGVDAEGAWTKAEHETYGWNCGQCWVWIPNEGHEPSVSIVRHERDEVRAIW